ncbi:MAG: glycosyltransferase [Candidatus Hydrogenedentes bacterium]|nr:glycosyltransferase [Candidatus Hydrogenedentota bacterium]
MFALGCVVLAIALCVLALCIWNALAWPAPGLPGAPQDEGAVSVLIPARNEASSIQDCVESALAQGDIAVEILVYDDHSTDGTGELVAALQTRDARVRVLQPMNLPEGWCGKNFACARLAAAARGQWLLFLDADARLRDGAIARMLHEVKSRNVTLLSCWPGFVMSGFAERLLMPMLNFLVFSIFPAPLSLFRWDASLGLAHGACLFVERAAYARVGGHEAVRNEIFEDTRIARVWRQRGERGICLDGQDVVRVRMYGSFAEIWRGFRKNFFPAFHHAYVFWIFLAFHAVVFLLPFAALLLLMIDLQVAFPWIAAAATVLASRLVIAWRFRQPLWPALLHPIAEVALLSLGVTSWWRCATGRGVDWKGRQYRATH